MLCTIVLAGTGIAPGFVSQAHADAPIVATVPWVAIAPSIPHDVISG
ncbi:MAG: hypothetical protein O2780_20485 [Proteobacteria bacterium]|nr:hypothetical protein [Pseudomonadota bacterium]